MAQHGSPRDERRLADARGAGHDEAVAVPGRGLAGRVLGAARARRHRARRGPRARQHVGLLVDGGGPRRARGARRAGRAWRARRARREARRVLVAARQREHGAHLAAPRHAAGRTARRRRHLHSTGQALNSFSGQRTFLKSM